MTSFIPRWEVREHSRLRRSDSHIDLYEVGNFKKRSWIDHFFNIEILYSLYRSVGVWISGNQKVLRIWPFIIYSSHALIRRMH